MKKIEKAYQVWNLDQLRFFLKSGFSGYQRIYFGVDTCVFKSIHEITQIDEIFDLLENTGLSLTFVTSFIPQKYFNHYMSLLEYLINKGFRGFEITINDYGLLNRFHEKGLFSQIKVNIGTMLYYQIKDPYAKFVNKKNADRISIDNEEIKEIFQKYSFSGLETYRAFSGFSLDVLDYDVFVYAPYVMYSLSRACHAFLIKSSLEKSTIVESCQGCPLDYGKYVLSQTLKWQGNEFISYNAPNGQYYPNENMDFGSVNVVRTVDNSLIIG